MFTVANLGRVCDMLVADGLMHDGQVKDVMVRYSIQEKRILIDRRNHLRKAMGRRRISYEVGEMEIIASFAFPLPEREKHKLTEHMITECVARHLSLPFYIPDPTKLDYKLVTSTFPGQFAERHLIIPIGKTKRMLTLAVANPVDTELLESLKRYTGSGVELVLAPKSEMLKTKNFGRKSLNEIKDTLISMGLTLGMTVENLPLRKDLEKMRELREA